MKFERFFIAIYLHHKYIIHTFVSSAIINNKIINHCSGRQSHSSFFNVKKLSKELGSFFI